jgi:hypothetical protein
MDGKMQGTNKKRKPAPFKAKKRVLNIVYFLDAKKTKSLKIPMPMAKGLFAFIALGVVWSVASIFVVGMLESKVSNLQDDLVESNQVIFDYQARFDGVYEAAYPSKKSNLYELVNRAPEAIAEENIVSSADPKNSIGIKDSKERESEVKLRQTVALAAKSLGENNPATSYNSRSGEIESSDVREEVEDQNSKSERLTDNKKEKIFPDLKIKKARIKPGKDGTVLSILLKNQSSKKVSGYVWAVATLEENGEVKHLVSPSRVSLNENGTISDPKKSNKFALRNFSNKKFKFPIGADQISSLSHIKVGLMRNDGSIRKVKIPIKK